MNGVVLRAAAGRLSVGRYAVSEGVDFGRVPATPEDVAEAWPVLAGSLVRPE